MTFISSSCFSSETGVRISSGTSLFVTTSFDLCKHRQIPKPFSSTLQLKETCGYLMRIMLWMVTLSFSWISPRSMQHNLFGRKSKQCINQWILGDTNFILFCGIYICFAFSSRSFHSSVAAVHAGSSLGTEDWSGEQISLLVYSLLRFWNYSAERACVTPPLAKQLTCTLRTCVWGPLDDSWH